MRDLTGQTLGEYEIVERVGCGAMADVYKAFQPKLNRYVAIKVLSPILAGEAGFRERFVREAQAIAQLDHPNILPVYDFDRQNDLTYIVTQFVDTGSLADLLDRPLPLDLALHILEQVGSALSHAHSQGVVHRDVKPSNILLGPRNWALLADFGLVKTMEIPSNLTPTGMSLGTPAYMAPEQVTGDPVDARADVYALGTTLYQMLTARVPFEGDSGVAVALKHVREAPPAPRSLNPGLPEAVDHVIAKALAKNREARFGSVDDLVAAFREIAGSTTATPRRPAGEQSATTIVAKAIRQTTVSLETQAQRTQIAPASPPPAPIPLAAIWPSTAEEGVPTHGGSGWGLLAAVAGALVGIPVLYWGIAAGIRALLERLR
jgi:serine/threonine-protein kinase